MICNNDEMQKGLMHPASISTTKNTYGRAAIKYQGQARSQRKGCTDDPDQGKSVRLIVGFCGVEFC